MATIATVAGAMGKGWKLVNAVHGKENFANIYVVVAMPTGGGKSAPAEVPQPITKIAFNKIFQQWLKEKEENHKRKDSWQQEVTRLKSLLRSRRIADEDRLIGENRLAEAQTEIRRIDRWLEEFQEAPAYHVGNTTLEALGMALARNKETMFAYTSDGGELLDMMIGKGGSLAFDLWLKGYSVEQYDLGRISRAGIHIDPCLTVFLLFQPEPLAELFSSRIALGRGLIGRILACQSNAGYFEEGLGDIRMVAASCRQNWENLVAQLIEMREISFAAGRPRIVNCSPAARQVLFDFHKASLKLLKGPFQHVAAHLKRWRENACRIALGLCIADNPNASTLTGEQARRAVKIARWAQLSSLQILLENNSFLTAPKPLTKKESKMERLCSLIQKKQEVTLRILDQHHNFTPEEVRALDKEFPNRIRITEKSTGGRPSLVATLV
jgi:hypothetical protein